MKSYVILLSMQKQWKQNRRLFQKNRLILCAVLNQPTTSSAVLNDEKIKECLQFVLCMEGEALEIFCLIS